LLSEVACEHSVPNGDTNKPEAIPHERETQRWWDTVRGGRFQRASKRRKGRRFLTINEHANPPETGLEVLEGGCKLPLKGRRRWRARERDVVHKSPQRDADRAIASAQPPQELPDGDSVSNWAEGISLLHTCF
jgi:hypothetical protein